MRQAICVFIVVLVLTIVTGCNSPATTDALMTTREGAVSFADVMVKQTPLSGSLFSSDTNLLGNEAAQEVLRAPVPVPRNAKVALLNLTSGGVGLRMYDSYWRTEEYMDLQYRYVQTLVDGIARAERVREVVPIPSIMISQNMTLPQMREAAVRLQADLLVIYGVRSELFRKTRFFEKDEAKAFATCELLLFDTRTGVIPFTTVLTEKYLTTRQPEDFGWSETEQRAQSEATLQVLEKAGAATAKFLEDFGAGSGQ